VGEKTSTKAFRASASPRPVKPPPTWPAPDVGGVIPYRVCPGLASVISGLELPVVDSFWLEPGGRAIPETMPVPSRSRSGLMEGLPLRNHGNAAAGSNVRSPVAR